MGLGRSAMRYMLLTVLVIILPLGLGSALDDDTAQWQSLNNQVEASQPGPEQTQIASVWEHTARERSLQGHRKKAAERQEARVSGWTLDRILEVAVHPMFLLVLAIPFLGKSRRRKS